MVEDSLNNYSNNILLDNFQWIISNETDEQNLAERFPTNLSQQSKKRITEEPYHDKILILNKIPDDHTNASQVIIENAVTGEYGNLSETNVSQPGKSNNCVREPKNSYDYDKIIENIAVNATRTGELTNDPG